MGRFLLFFLSILSLSQAANLVRLAAAPPLMIGFWRILGSALIMLGLHFWQAQRKSKPFLTQVSLSVWTWTLASGTFFFLHLWTFFFAAQNTTIANCMVIFAINPLFTAVGSWLFLNDRFERRHGFAFLLAFLGIYALASQNLNWQTGLPGDLSALASAALFSGYLISSKKARLHLNTEQFTGLIYLWAAALFLTFALSKNIPLLDYPSITWWAVAGNILIPTLLGHVLFTYLLKFFNINWMSCGKLLEPGLSALVAYFAFNEGLKPGTLVAFVFFSSSVLVLVATPLFKQSKI